MQMILYGCTNQLKDHRVINICLKYGVTHDIIYNCNQTVCMSIPPKGFTLINLSKLILGVRRLSIVSRHKHLGEVLRGDMYDDEDMAGQLSSFMQTVIF